MTDIDSLPAGRELDALVAEKVMGWSELHWEQAKSGSTPLRELTSWSQPLWWHSPEGWYGKGPNGECYLTKGFSTDIAAAREVEDKIKELHLEEKYGDYLAREIIGTRYDAGRGLYGNQVFDLAHATPLQRCRAALKAVIAS